MAGLNFLRDPSR